MILEEQSHPTSDYVMPVSYTHLDVYKRQANDTYLKMQQRIWNGYMMMSDTLHYPVIPVGAVWRNIREMHPDIDLYFTDRYHPNALGSFTAACTAYASIYKESPVGGTAPKRVDSTYWKVIEQAAANVVLKLSLIHI